MCVSFELFNFFFLKRLPLKQVLEAFSHLLNLNWVRVSGNSETLLFFNAFTKGICGVFVQYFVQLNFVHFLEYLNSFVFFRIYLFMLRFSK